MATDTPKYSYADKRCHYSHAEVCLGAKCANFDEVGNCCNDRSSIVLQREANQIAAVEVTKAKKKGG